MAGVILDVSEGTKVKRKWVIGVLGILLLVSSIMFFLGYPFNKGTSLIFVISFFVAFILKVVDWIEGSKLVEKKLI